MPIVVGEISKGPLAGARALRLRDLANGGVAVRLLDAKGAYEEGALVHLGSGELVATKALEPRPFAVLGRVAAGQALARNDLIPMGALARARLIEAERDAVGAQRWIASAFGKALLRVHARTKARDVRCSLCGTPGPREEAHRHQGALIGDGCCWDDRLKSSE